MQDKIHVLRIEDIPCEWKIAGRSGSFWLAIVRPTPEA